MRREWVSILGAGLCISFVPACTPLLRQPPPNDLPASATAKRQEPVDSSEACATPRAPPHPGTADPAVKPAAGKETIIEPARYPARVTGPDLIPEPRNRAEASAAAGAPPPEQGTQAGSPADAKAKPAEEPPLLQALRCVLDNRPDEAVAWLGRYDKQSQEWLLCLLPLAVRLTEGGWQRYDSREASAVVDQLDRLAEHVTARLRPRAELSIKKMCFCSVIESYGKYVPIPDDYGFQPGEHARIYVELQNLWDQRQGAAYSIYLRSTIMIREFNGQGGWSLEFRDRGPDVSQTERHDFCNVYHFVVPPKISPGFHTLYLEITDVSTGRKVCHTLDFRAISPYGKGEW